MKVKELEKELNRCGVPKVLYNLDGKGRKDERFCLELKENTWEVYYSERGIKTTKEEFNTEEEACEYIYNRLTK